jgi:hypothetical protein
MRTRAQAAALLATGLFAVACGSTPVERPAPWAAAHPDPAGMHFADAPGLCAFAVRYPNDAPGEIDYQGNQFIQRGRTDSRSIGGPAVAKSADWTIHQPGPTTLVLVTSTRDFLYQSGSKCGSNSAPPT